MAKAKKSKTARKKKTKTKVKRRTTRLAPKRKPAQRKIAAKPKPVEGVTAKIGHAVNVVVETIKETAEMRRKMHADQPEE